MEFEDNQAVLLERCSTSDNMTIATYNTSMCSFLLIREKCWLCVILDDTSFMLILPIALFAEFFQWL